MELLKESGYSVIEESSEEVKDKDYISVGTVLSDGERGLSISYIPDNSGIYISFANEPNWMPIKANHF